jgi:hypothetical protein
MTTRLDEQVAAYGVRLGIVEPLFHRVMKSTPIIVEVM